MPRPKNLDPTIYIRVGLPQLLWTRLNLFLFSEIEGRVPLGKYQEFFVSRIQEFFEHRHLDLAPYGFAPGYYVTGPKPMLDMLEQRLKEESNGRSDT